MTENERLALAAKYTGAPESEMEVLCNVSEKILKSWLKEGTDGQSIQEEWMQATAAYAAGLYFSMDGTGVKSYKAGSVSVVKETGEERACHFWNAAKAILRPYMQTDDFAFRSVEG